MSEYPQFLKIKNTLKIALINGPLHLFQVQMQAEKGSSKKWGDHFIS